MMKTLMETFAHQPEEEPAPPAKRRRVDEYTPRLTTDQWLILERLALGSVFSLSEYPSLIEEMSVDSFGVTEHVGWHGKRTTNSLVRRNLIERHDGKLQLTDEGRKALRLREENKPGQL